MKETQINFRFAKNWKTFLTWYNSTKKGTHSKGADWTDQKKMISKTFELTVPNIIDWDELWVDFENWFKEVTERKQTFWAEHQRQIETLMLGQLKSLNEHNFILAYLDRGVPTVDSEKFSYWEAVKVKKELEGDKNGKGGNEDLDKITIINLKQILK